MHIARLIIGLLLFLLSTPYVVAVTDIPIDANGVSLRESTLLFTDTDSRYTTLSSLLSDNIGFVPLADKPLGMTKARHWLKIELQNPHNQPHNWYLELGYPSLHYLHAYWKQGSKISTIIESTAESTFAERAIDEPILFIPLSMAAHERKTLYINYRSMGDVPLELKLYSPLNFTHFRHLEASTNSLLIGFMLAFFCTISVHWLLNRNATYLLYTALVLCMTLVVSDMSGYNFKYLWPEQGAWSLQAPPLILTFTYIFYLLFIREFLFLKAKNSRLYQVYTGGTILIIPIFIFTLLLNTIEPLVIFGILLIPLLVFTSFWVHRQQLASAKVFSISIFSHVFFVNIMFISAVIGLINFIDAHPTTYAKIGYALEVLFFSVALAVQNRQLRIDYTSMLKSRLKEAETLALVEKDKNELMAETQNKILQFASTTHDLAQPLSSVRMAIEAIPEETGKEIKQHIDKTISYAEQLLRSIIHDAKADVLGRKVDTKLSDIFEQAIAHHELQASVKGIYLSYFPSRLSILASPQSLLRILDNLLANAIRYTDRGRVFLGARQKSNHIDIQIWDTGRGMDPSIIERLLQPFEQSGQAEIEMQGFGLGLYIVKILCEKSGYELSIYSQPGKGSCFSISIRNM
ncbi:MAG: sensor histidine kinase [Candidatus Thiodiazotropha sp. (ex Monitilora ramsayi)]|nr:sensor histidine kinase [Candidatus Thiodiazotropha sp. (ex Monitilora ramsayi)]